MTGDSTLTTDRTFNAEWIWGDDHETEVYAQGYGAGITIIFRFKKSVDHPRSLGNRIVAYYHKHNGDNVDDDDDDQDVSETPPVEETFESREAMRDRTWSAVEEMWPKIIDDPAAVAPGAVIDIDSQDDGPIQLHIVTHPGFLKYLELMKTGDSHGQSWVRNVSNTVPFDHLVRYDQLGGRGCATKVHLKEAHADNIYVFKGVDFRTFLTYTDGEDDRTLKHLIKTWHHANNVVATLPPHPNILSPSRIAVTAAGLATPVVCGCLYQYFANGDVGCKIEAANAHNIRIPLDTKRKWCLDMVKAVLHTHRAGQTYHMDIKPGNFLIDNDQHLLLIDWEQSDAPATTLAPEADGTWDVEESPVTDHLLFKLLYRKYEGPDRRNMDEDAPGDHPWNIWNVFAEWIKTHPRAVELAEVFSVGRSMWMLLRQPDIDWDGVDYPTDVKTDWDDSDDIPEAWRSTVEQCMDEDPNKRPDLDSLHALIGSW